MHKTDHIKQFLDLDWTKKPYIFILSFLFILSRFPLLNLGFGSDPDAWRIANSAFDLHYFGIYHPSRFPGLPLPEFFNSLIINYGWLATNIATMIISLISVYVFSLILKELNIKNKGLLVVTFAFLPILWINSASTMDYMWALTFILIAWFLIIKKQYAIAGLVMGLAIGSRLTSALLIIPFLYLIFVSNKKKNMLYFVISACITAFFLFLPLHSQYGFNFLTYYPEDVDVLTLFINFGYYFGFLALIMLGLILVLSMKNLISNLLKKDVLTIFLLSSTLLILALFIKTPYEIAYIIPAVPFGLLLLNNISKRKFFSIFCIFLLLNSVISIFPLDSHNDISEDGLVIEDGKLRATLLDQSYDLIDANINNSIVITSEYLPSVCYLYEASAKTPKLIGMVGFNYFETKEHANSQKNITYVYLVSLDKIKELHKKGYNVYYAGDWAFEMTKYIYGYDLNNYNCSNIIESY